ncbi:MAG: hypothetical protein KGJ62_06095 [Armatimonadetes bacterium]|nr:hypothetical protein [Armatimonadota bacterium]MDE2205915.1 hypothetical protein [Armatimonadota bacterium]
MSTRTAIDSHDVAFERERGVVAVEVTRQVCHAVIDVGDGDDRPTRILNTFQTLATAHVPVFLIKLHRTAVTLGLAGLDAERAEAAIASGGMQVRLRCDLALIVVRASSMRDLSGIMSQIADALFVVGAHMLATGDSHSTVQCIIEDDRANAVAQELATVFGLEPSGIVQRPLPEAPKS